MRQARARGSFPRQGLGIAAKARLLLDGSRAHGLPGGDVELTGQEPSTWEARQVTQPVPGVFNADAGGAVQMSPADWERVLTERFAERGWRVKLRCLAAAEVAGALREAVAQDPPAVIVGGGDGTVVSAVSALEGRKTPLGIVPLGTFNTLARELGIPPRWAEAIDVLSNSQVREIDVARVNGRPFLSLCVMGFLANPAFNAGQGLPWWVKAMRTIWVTLRSYVDYPALKVSLETGSGLRGYRTRLMGVANNPFRDEAGLIVPQRLSLDAGQLAIYVSRHADRWAVMRGGLAFLTGRMTDDPDLSIELARGALIEVGRRKWLRLAVDGEVVRESLPLRFTMHPRQLRVLVPAGTDETHENAETGP